MRRTIITPRTSMQWVDPKEFWGQPMRGKPKSFRRVRHWLLAGRWQRHFAVSYIEFRQRVQEIAMHNLQAVANAEVLPLGDMLRQLQRLDSDAVVVPIDDDDWLPPDLVSHIPNAGRAWRWKRVLLRGSVFDGASLPHVNNSNNTAVTVERLRAMPQKAARQWLNWHWKDGSLGPALAITGPTSIQVRHPASSCLIAVFDKRPYEPATHHEQLRRWVAPQPIPAELAWVEPHYAALMDLYREALREEPAR